MLRHAPADDVTHGVEVGATVVVDHALGVAGGAGGVVERYRPPFVVGQRPVEFGVPWGYEGFVVHLAQQLATEVGFA